MRRNNNGGSSSHETAAKNYNTRRQYNSSLSVEEAQSQLRSMGFEYTENMPSVGVGRIPARGKGPGNRSTGIKWTDDGQALHWCEFTSDEQGTIFSDRAAIVDAATISKKFNEARERKRKADAEVAFARDRAARQARNLWRESVKDGRHSYVEKKMLSSTHNARLHMISGALVIPMWKYGVGLVNLQRIYPNGEKFFLKGGIVKGAYSVIGTMHHASKVLLTEGWATGVSLHEEYALPVVVAFNAGNLKPVCQALRESFKDIEIIVAGDDDRYGDVNVGRQKAIEAADSVGATLLFPELCKACNCTDHNDAFICRRRRHHG